LQPDLQMGDLIVALSATPADATPTHLIGGDGTVNEVASGIAGMGGVELAVIPRGTGIDFVRTYGIPAKLEGAVKVALGGHTRTIDAGRAAFKAWSGEAAEAWFVNAAGAGMSGAVAKRT